MPGFSYHHLHYFWVVAREGSITAASRVLGVTQPTISTQIADLEADLDVQLFRRRGNRLELTEEGRMVQKYAADIFTLGEALETAVRHGGGEVPARFAVGISDSLPLLSAHHLLGPALEISPVEMRLVLRVDKKDALLSALSSRTLDLVLTDTPVSPSAPVRVLNHLLEESEVSLFAAPRLKRELIGTFPECLDDAPFIFHTENTPLRRGVDGWLARHRLHPRIAAEVEDVGLLQLLGQEGRGVFAAPSLVEEEICRRYRVETLGRADGVVERFFGVTLPRHGDHPALVSMLAPEKESWEN